MNGRKRYLGLLMGSALLTGCATPSTQGTNKVPPQAVSVEKVQASPLTIGDTFLGTVTPYIKTDLSLGTNGTMASINVHAGDVVRKGQLLAVLDSTYTSQQENTQNQAQAAFTGAQQQYEDALALYNDRTSASQQLTSAQGSVDQQKTAVQVAQVNLQKAQLQEQASLNGGGSPDDAKALQSVVDADQQAVTSAEQQLQESEDNLVILKQTLTTAQTQDGNITAEQVQQAYQNYMDNLSRYNSWQQGAFTGTNPYYGNMQATQAIYQGLNGGYTALTQAQQQYNSGVSAVSQATSGLASAKAQLQNAQKNLSDGIPDGASNIAQQAKLTVTAAEASLNQAKQQYNNAVENLKIAQTMYNDRTQSKQSLDNALNSLNQSRASLSSASVSLQVQVKNGQIISPIDGYVQDVNVQIGENVGPQTQIMTVASTAPEIASVKVPEFDIGKIKVGTKVSIYLPDIDTSLNGTVQTIHPQLDSATNQYPVDVQFDDPNHVAHIGLLAEARLQTSSSQTTIVVPADSVLTLQSGAQQVFVEKNGVAQAKIVQVGSMSGNQYQITSGLNLGDELVVKGQNLLSDGDKVKVVSTNGG